MPTAREIVQGNRLGEGTYEVTIKSVEESVAGTGTPQLTFIAVTDEGKETRWWRSLVPAAMVFLTRDLLESGVIDGDYDFSNDEAEAVKQASELAQELRGARVNISISARLNKKTGETRMETRIVSGSAAEKSDVLARL